jgi:hypothetical protein
LQRGEAARLALPTGFNSEEAQIVALIVIAGSSKYPVFLKFLEN